MNLAASNSKRKLSQISASERLRTSFEKQIFDLANAVRVRNDKKPLQWNDKIAGTARKHSGDAVVHQSYGVKMHPRFCSRTVSHIGRTRSSKELRTACNNIMQYNKKRGLTPLFTIFANGKKPCLSIIIYAFGRLPLIGRCQLNNHM